MPYDVIDNIEGVQSLAREWLELESRVAGHVFQSHAFVVVWLTTAGKAAGVRPCVVVYREEGRICGIAPLCLHPRGPLRLITWLGGFQIVDYGDVLFDGATQTSCDDFMEQSLSAIRGATRHNLYYLPNVRHNALAFPYLSRHFLVNDHDVAPAFRLEGGFEPFLDSLKRFRKKLKSDTLRQEKRLAQFGNLRFAVVTHDDPLLHEILSTFLEQKQRCYSASGIDGVLFRPGYGDFYRSLPHLDPSAHISALLLDDRVIATHVGYLYGSTFYYLMPSYSPEFEKYSPGRVLMFRLVEECFRRGVDCFDLGRGNEPYKYEWTDRETGLTTFVSPSLTGWLFNCACNIRKRLRRRSDR
jgi:CelD/BcsL family acetyltransferase involved in cellulose biosynthesis